MSTQQVEVKRLRLFNSSNPQQPVTYTVTSNVGDTCTFEHIIAGDPENYQRTPSISNQGDLELSNPRLGTLRLMLNTDFLHDRYDRLQNPIAQSGLVNEDGFYSSNVIPNESYPIDKREDYFANWKRVLYNMVANPPKFLYTPVLGDLTIDYISEETVQVQLDTDYGWHTGF